MLDAAPASDDERMVAFVSPGCWPCEDLVDGLTVAVEEGRLGRDDMFFVVWVRADDEAEVRATPTVFIISGGDYEVLDYNLEGEAQWVLNHLKPREEIRLPS